MTPSRKLVLICGASGSAGRAAAIALRAADHRVTALGRTPARIAGVTDIAGDVTEPSGLSPLFSRLKPDVVVSCIAARSRLPQEAWAIDHAANLNLLVAARAAGTGQFVMLSAIGVQKPQLGYLQARLAFEQALMASGLDWTILRPSASFAALSGQIDRLRSGKPYLICGDGSLTACKPISVADLGSYIADCLNDPARRNAILPVGGPGPALTPREIGAALFRALGLPERYRSVSPLKLRLAAGGLSFASRLHPGLATRAELARIAHYEETESMLVWDAAAGRYDADATPSFGSDRLADHFRALSARP